MPHSALNPSTPTLALVARRRSWLPSLELRPSISRRAELHRGHHSWARSAIDAAAHRTGVECDMKEGREVFDWFSCRCFWLFFLLRMFRLASMEMLSDCSSCRVLSAFGWKQILRYTLMEDLTNICLAGLILDSSFPLGMKFWVQLRILVEIWVWILHVVPLDTISLLCDVDFGFKELMGFGCSMVKSVLHIGFGFLVDVGTDLFSLKFTVLFCEDVSLDTTEGLWTE
ncbi:hypothetical protein ZIOFF_062787 [Zingiber officinale]|uniref:Uncharacterized protein n=1 Tax=Zingiber officinale TaxID=94328 RepID=A0A8J5KFN1_ZINOF|nr:hypothetical protein ZIOFF_062787 [Zingiber officinale]